MDQAILIVDDDMQLTSFLSRFLNKHGYKVQTAASGAQARALFDIDTTSLIVLDLNLPDVDGFDIAKEIRAQAQTPIIMLSARDEVFDRIVGLELGADDYLTKPYEPRELLARIKAVLRRLDTVPEPLKEQEFQRAHFSGLELDFVTRGLRNSADQRAIPLTGAEFTLLKALVHKAGQILGRNQIMSELYGNSMAVTDRAVDAHISRLRRKIDPDNADNSVIQSVRSEGYILAAEVEFQ